MDELVYLFELDSVRNSPQEILRAQWAMFREVALKGNRVVLSFNQLTDSEGFLCGVRDPKLYPHLAALFEMGVLKYRTKGAAYPYTGKRAFGLHAERSRLCQVL